MKLKNPDTEKQVEPRTRGSYKLAPAMTTFKVGFAWQAFSRPLTEKTVVSLGKGEVFKKVFLTLKNI
jgi:hypothetical protein